jgi:hypothetical protein
MGGSCITHGEIRMRKNVGLKAWRKETTRKTWAQMGEQY